MRILILALLLAHLTAYQLTKCQQLPFLPMPKKLSCNTTNLSPTTPLPNPCNISFLIKSQNKKQSFQHIKILIEDQMYKTFRCRYIHFFNIQSQSKIYGDLGDMVVDVQIVDHALRSAFGVGEEAYRLSITRERARIQASHYVGFVYGLETFLQSITCNKNYKQCFMQGLPIQIQDEPLYSYRGLMIDTAHHFLSPKIIKQTITAMMYNKLNILHWHITDDDSFPLQLKSHPQISKYATFNPDERYTSEEIKDIVSYAMLRGVRIIPEIDTPFHAGSWFRAQENADLGCLDLKGKGQIDVTLEASYMLVRDVFREIFELFPDPYVHLGTNNMMNITCMKNLTEFLTLQKISQKDFYAQYRKKQKAILHELNSSKIFINWQSSDNVVEDKQSIVHWNGRKLVPEFPNTKIILSPHVYTNLFNLESGVGDLSRTYENNYATWLDMYEFNFGKQVAVFQQSRNVIGAVLVLWSQLSNQFTHHPKIWIRSSAMAERFWTDQNFEQKPDFFWRIVSHERLMKRRGIPTAPATCRQCEQNPQFC